MQRKNNIKADTINAPIYQGSTIINSPGMALRMVGNDPQMIQAFMDEIAMAVSDKEDTVWVLDGGKAESKQIPRLKYEEEKTVGIVVDPYEREFFASWIKRSMRAEDAETIIAKIREDGEVDIEHLKLNPDQWVKRCEVGIQKIETIDSKHNKLVEDTVYYDNLFVNNAWKVIPGATILSTLNADRGFRPIFMKLDSGEIVIKYQFHPRSWDDLKWYSMFQIRQNEEAVVYLRYADDQYYIFRKTVLPEWSINNQLDYNEVIRFIDYVSLIEERFHVKISVNEKLDASQSEFIILLANSINSQLTEYRWEEGWFELKPTQSHLKELIALKRDEAFSVVFQDLLSCNYKSVVFERYRCNNILDSVCIANYDEVQRLYKENKYPILLKLKPVKSKKLHRILEIPGINVID